MPYLTKTAILSADDRKFEVVEVPEWGGLVRLGTMTAAARDRYEIAFADARANPEKAVSMRALLVASCIVDETGELMFTPEDVELLGKKSGAALQRLWTRALEMNILTKEAADKISGN